MDVRFLVLLLVLAVSAWVYIYYARPKHPVDLIWGTVCKTDILHSRNHISSVTIKVPIAGDETRFPSTELITLTFDTRCLDRCNHPEGEECFHGRAVDIAKISDFGNRITVTTRDMEGKTRKVFKLVMPSIN